MISSTIKGTSDESFLDILFSPTFYLVITFFLVLVAVLISFINLKQNIDPGPETALLTPSGPGYSSNIYNVDNLKLVSLLGQGKYGSVWKGKINEDEVAVKIFQANNKQYFINERNIYTTPLIESPALLNYFGSDERHTLEESMQYFLVLSIAPSGCLQDWLQSNTFDYKTFCNMVQSVSRGLSHLHTELQLGEDMKPCIVHRDLNSRNILIKPDLTCCLSDFGFALKVYGNRYEYKGELMSTSDKSINEVGTLRYMAPEILEGAVNLRDCETALKQIDVYSLGLVLWEIATRCEDFYAPGQEIPAYRLPYEAEIGKNPTFEQMQVLVARRKARPMFVNGWGGGPAGRIVKDTCEDCWDHDAEARLTSLCAEERMLELIHLRPKSHISRGPSPPLSANNLVPLSPTITTSSPSYSINEVNIVTPIIHSITSNGTEKNHLNSHPQIQAFQGRNPCIERNLAPPNNRRINQILIEKSRKHSFQKKGEENSFSCLEHDICVEDLLSNSRRLVLSEDNSILGRGFPKQNNTDKKLRGWHGVRALIQKKLFRKDKPYAFPPYNDKSNLVENKSSSLTTSPVKDITVNLYCNGTLESSISPTQPQRPSNLDLLPINVRINHQDMKSNLIKNISDEFKSNVQQRTIVPKSESTSAVKDCDDLRLTRQRSLEIFREVFQNNRLTADKLRDPSQRVKTPGDVPPSVRRIRASKTLSLYDDRMMDTTGLNTL